MYRGNPHSGGQGVYTRYLSRHLVRAGHQVTVFAGQSWPVLDADAHLVVVGSLHETSPVHAVIGRLGIADAVSFATRVSDDRLVELYAEAQVAVVPSLYEGFSLPAVEAMSCGVPLVATTGGALPEVVGTGGETGLLVPRAT